MRNRRCPRNCNADDDSIHFVYIHMGRESEGEAKPGDLPNKTNRTFLRGLRNGDADVFIYQFLNVSKLPRFEEVVFLRFIRL